MSGGATANSDLKSRVITGVVLAVICFATIYIGGTPLLSLTSLLAGVMCWELFRLCKSDNALLPYLSGALGAIAVWFAASGFVAIGIVVMAALVGAGLIILAPKWKTIFAIYALVIASAGLAIFLIRDTHGLGALIWLILIVVASDVAGYFVGRKVGGPKFWPAISPKKTWSGVVGGWALAALVSMAMAGIVELSVIAAAVWGVVLAFVSQMGDIAESWIKRRAGVKDSSAILPGHGGFMDRFDGLVAVMAAAVICQSLLFT